MVDERHYRLSRLSDLICRPSVGSNATHPTLFRVKREPCHWSIDPSIYSFANDSSTIHRHGVRVRALYPRNLWKRNEAASGERKEERDWWLRAARIIRRFRKALQSSFGTVSEVLFSPVSFSFILLLNAVSHLPRSDAWSLYLFLSLVSPPVFEQASTHTDAYKCMRRHVQALEGRFASAIKACW